MRVTGTARTGADLHSAAQEGGADRERSARQGPGERGLARGSAVPRRRRAGVRLLRRAVRGLRAARRAPANERVARGLSRHVPNGDRALEELPHPHYCAHYQVIKVEGMCIG